MTRISGRALGTWSLRIDAAYCFVLGLFVAFAAVTAASSLIVLAIVAIALDVALFAASRALALRALRTPAGLSAA